MNIIVFLIFLAKVSWLKNEWCLLFFKCSWHKKLYFHLKNTFYANIFFLILFSSFQYHKAGSFLWWSVMKAAVSSHSGSTYPEDKVSLSCLLMMCFHIQAVFGECFCLQNSFLKPLSHACSHTLHNVPLFEADIKTVLPDISFIPIVYLLPLKSHNLCISVQMCSRFMRLESSKPSQQQFLRWS